MVLMSLMSLTYLMSSDNTMTGTDGFTGRPVLRAPRTGFRSIADGLLADGLLADEVQTVSLGTVLRLEVTISAMETGTAHYPTS